MIKDMKNPARILIGTVCCLSLFSAQAVFCAPDTPLDTVAAIDLQVQEVGARCGFENVNHFINLFRKNTGMTPGVFRKTEHADLV